MFLNRQILKLTGVLALIGAVGLVLLATGGKIGRFATVQAVKMVEYRDSGGLTFRYPSGWTVAPRIQGSRELLSMVDFLASDKSVYGIVQVWRPGKPLDDFIEDSKAGKAENIEVKEVKKARLGGREGYFIEYTLLPKGLNPKVRPVEVKDFIFEEKGLFFRIMYSLPNAAWDGENEEIFAEMVKSLTLRKN